MAIEDYEVEDEEEQSWDDDMRDIQAILDMHTKLMEQILENLTARNSQSNAA